MFYLGAMLLGLLAAAFACWPLLRSRHRAAPPALQHHQAVRDVYRARLNELESETEDAALRAEIEHELGALFLSEQLGEDKPGVGVSAKTGELANTTGKRRPSVVTWLMAVLIPVCGAVLYYSVSDPALQEIRGAEEVLTLAAEEEVALESWALRLAARTQVSPEDSKSWYLLGHARLKLARYASAAEAFAITSKLAGEDLNIQVYWLQARFMAAAGQLDEFSRNLAAKILEQQPNMSVVLEILALDAFRRGEGEQSISLLNRAVTGAADIRQQASFALAISQVRAGLTEPPPGVTVDVSTPGQVPPHASIFVIARPPGGGMPYAVVKRPAFLVPFAVRLDDLVSMSPARKLSDAEKFEVIVRLSASGAAMAQKGDWQWQSPQLNAVADGLPALDAIIAPP